MSVKTYELVFYEPSSQVVIPKIFAGKTDVHKDRLHCTLVEFIHDLIYPSDTEYLIKIDDKILVEILQQLQLSIPILSNDYLILTFSDLFIILGTCAKHLFLIKLYIKQEEHDCEDMYFSVREFIKAFKLVSIYDALDLFPEVITDYLIENGEDYKNDDLTIDYLIEEFKQMKVFNVGIKDTSITIKSKEELNEIAIKGLNRVGEFSCVVQNETPEDNSDLQFITFKQPLQYDRELLKQKIWEIERVRYDGQLTVTPKLHKMLENCLKSDTLCIIVPISLTRYDILDKQRKVMRNIKIGEDIRGTPMSHFQLAGHRVLLIINKLLKTIEFFDPNGSEAHIDMYGLYDQEAIKKYLLKNFSDQIEDYEFKVYMDTCVSHSFQYYESLIPKKSDDLGGYCIVWSVFTAHMRILYPYVQADVLIKALLRYFDLYDRPYLRIFIRKYVWFLANIVDINFEKVE